MPRRACGFEQGLTSEDYMGMVEECQAPKVNVNGQKLTYVPLTSRSSEEQIKALKEVCMHALFPSYCIVTRVVDG